MRCGVEISLCIQWSLCIVNSCVLHKLYCWRSLFTARFPINRSLQLRRGPPRKYLHSIVDRHQCLVTSYNIRYYDVAAIAASTYREVFIESLHNNDRVLLPRGKIHHNISFIVYKLLSCS
jgi:hypothetical protein